MKSTILASIIIIATVIVAVVVVQVTGVDLFQKQAKGGVVEVAISEILDTRRFKFKGKIEVDIKTLISGTQEDGASAALAGISSVKMFANVSSDIDQRNKNNLKTSSNINIGVDAGGVQMAGIIEMITVGSDLYVKLVSVPSMLTAFLGDIEEIRNQWIKIDFDSIKEQYKESVRQAGIELDEEDLSKQLKDLIAEMKELFLSKDIFDITKEFGVEEVNKISTKHYFVTANKEAIKEFILEYTELTKKYVPQEQKAEYEKKLKEVMKDFSNSFEDIWEKIGGISFDIWIEKRTGRLARILWRKDIDLSGFNDIPEEIESIGIEIDFSFFDFNKRVDIKAPSESKLLDEILSSIISTFAPQGLGLPQEF